MNLQVLFGDQGSNKNQPTPSSPLSSALDLAEGCLKYPLVEQYLKTKRFSHDLVLKYLACRGLTFLTLVLACTYLGYYITLATLTDEFPCDLRTGVLRNDSVVPEAVQCKLVAVGIFRLLSYTNLAVYVLLAPVVVYSALGPARQSSGFLKPYGLLPGFGTLGLVTPRYNDLSIYLLFLKANLSKLKSFKCLQVSHSNTLLYRLESSRYDRTLASLHYVHLKPLHLHLSAIRL